MKERLLVFSSTLPFTTTKQPLTGWRELLCAHWAILATALPYIARGHHPDLSHLPGDGIRENPRNHLWVSGCCGAPDWQREIYRQRIRSILNCLIGKQSESTMCVLDIPRYQRELKTVNPQHWVKAFTGNPVENHLIHVGFI